MKGCYAEIGGVEWLPAYNQTTGVRLLDDSSSTTVGFMEAGLCASDTLAGQVGSPDPAVVVWYVGGGGRQRGT